MQIYQFSVYGFLETCVGRGVIDSVFMIWGLEKPLSWANPKSWKFNEKIFSLREARTKNLVKFFVDTHGSNHSSANDYYTDDEWDAKPWLF